MRLKSITLIIAIAVLATLAHGQPQTQDQGMDLKPNKSTRVTFSGYVRDVACLMKYKEALKPTNDCAIMCARMGSPLVIVTQKGIMYFPISGTIPDTSEREKLMPFAGTYVKVTGEMYQRSGVRAIVIEQIQKGDDSKT